MGYQYRKINKDTYLIQGDGHESMYLISGRDRSMLVDAGMEPESLKQITDQLSDKSVFCVLTHGHFDHIGMCGEYEEVYLDEKDLDLYEKHSKGDMMPGMKFCCRKKEEILLMKKEFDLGEHRIVTVSLPGHTKGSVIFCDMKNRSVFCGDAVGSGCGVLMTAGLGSLPLDAYQQGLREAISELEQLGVDETWNFYGGHDGQQYASRTGPYNPVTLKLIKDMEILCGKLLDHSAEKQESVKETPFGSLREIIGIYGNAELQLLIEEETI
jgi:glyoxylase-like metal-dependent hydrolase (beta-lactamase superfamily II)